MSKARFTTTSAIIAIILLSQGVESSLFKIPRKSPPTTKELTAVDTNYDIYLYVSEWPGTVCKYNDCKYDNVKTRHFNLHGLWPQYLNGSWPQNCTNTPLNYDSFDQSLKTQLTEYWSGLYTKEEDFLGHEWGKHGTCWNPTFGVLNKMPTPLRPTVSAARARTTQSSSDFLKLVVSIIEDLYDFYAIFRNGGILPSDEQTYSLADMRKVISSKLGISTTGFALKCQDRKYLDTILVCLDKNYQPRDGCEKFLEGDCDDQVSYPLDHLQPQLE